MTEDFPPVFAVLSHRVCAVLTHADTVTEAFCGKSDGIFGEVNIKAGRAQTESRAEFAPGEGEISDLCGEDSPRIGDGVYFYPVSKIFL